MKVISVDNVHQALPEGVALLLREGVERDSRGGRVLVVPYPVTTQYRRPCDRVLFWPERDANPFFHLFEALWMLRGCRDVAFVTQFNKRMRTFSDNGNTFHGAYGYRWRNHFDRDQLDWAAQRLARDANDRRVVVSMYDPNSDQSAADAGGRDIPCNTHLYLWVDGGLNMTVSCRSNDIVWGAYGANAVHFSLLLEYMAARVSAHTCEQLPVGRMWQVSNNYHAYLTNVGPEGDVARVFDPLRPLAGKAADGYRLPTDLCPYSGRHVASKALVHNLARWEGELDQFVRVGEAWRLAPYHEPFFAAVAAPMRRAWEAWQQRSKVGRAAAAELAGAHLSDVEASDWRTACGQWLERRMNAANEKGLT